MASPTSRQCTAAFSISASAFGALLSGLLLDVTCEALLDVRHRGPRRRNRAVSRGPLGGFAGVYLVAAGVTGMGFGTAFSGVVASLAPKIPATERADTFAVIYVLAYLAFGVPAVAAGLLVGVVGLEAVCFGYGVVVITLAAVAFVLRVRRG